MSKCHDCWAGDAKHEDPRTPPIEEGDDVLCTDCFVNAACEVIEEAEGVVSDMRYRIAVAKGEA